MPQPGEPTPDRTSLAPQVVFLISRQSRTVTPQTGWLRATTAATRWAVDRGFTLVCGSGLLALDFARWAFGVLGGCIVPVEGPMRHEPASLRLRDRAVASLGDIFVAIAVRTGGIMEQEGLRALEENKRVHVVPPLDRGSGWDGNRRLLRAGATPLDIEISAVPAPPEPPFTELRPCPDDPREYLWHYTRAHPGPWPGESQQHYFRSLTTNAPGAAHRPIDTLRRILDERRIRASAHVIRGGHPVVCFSAADPSALLSRRTYRASLKGWDFEPYALGIDKSLAAGLRLKAVRYLPGGQYASLSPEERAFFQKHQANSTDWSHEDEWRHAGDLDLSGVPKEGLRVLKPPLDGTQSVSSGLRSVELFSFL